MAIDDKYIKAQALEEARNLLIESESFSELPEPEQRALFMGLYQEQYNKLAQSLSTNANGGNGRTLALAPAPAPKRASDLIDDRRHENRRIEQAGQLAAEFVRDVDFPGFVRDLLNGVFDANLQVTLKQMEQYQKLLKAATGDLAQWVRKLDDTAAFSYLAEKQGDDFGLSFSDDEEDSTGNAKGVLTDKQGNPVDLGDNTIKAKIMEAKIEMAKEHRKLLRETILMGITRLVVERGQVKASVLFDIKAQEQVQKADKAAMKEQASTSSSISGSSGLIGSIFGGPSGGHTSSTRKTQISVSSAKSSADTKLAAQITGFVDIQFKSDYFKLDNFLEIQKAEIAAETAKAGAKPAEAKPAP